MTFPAGIGGPMMSSCWPPYSVPPDGCIGAVFFAVRKRVVFLIFFFTLSVSTLNLYYSVHFHVAEGPFRSFRAFFFSVDPSVGELLPRLYSTGLINGTQRNLIQR